VLKVFCDFDGTVATEDVGNKLFRHVAGDRAMEIVRRYQDGVTGAVECFEQECLAAGNVPRDDFIRFVDQFEIDQSFEPFLKFCTENEIPVTILSDGLDVYVEHLLRKAGLAEIPYYANHLEFEKRGGMTHLVPSFPYTDSECDRCANCKRNHMLTLSGDDDVIVYVGDGYSDRCPVTYADIVFATGDLIKYCQSKNITYHVFRTFADVRQVMQSLVGKKRIPKRREAEMARREVFMQG
jgi:2-hydroxy-3-keto-5-methylthiopentenyl-1-phosphate phosphatase